MQEARPSVSFKEQVFFFFWLRILKEQKIEERDRGTLPEPPPQLVERNTVAASCSHGDWASTSLLSDSLQTLTLTFSDLGLKSFKFSLKHPILSKPQPLLSLIWVWKASNSHLNTRFSPNPNPYSLWSGSKKGASVWGLGSQMVSYSLLFFLCFYLWVWVWYAGSFVFTYGSEFGTTGLRDRQRTSVEVESMVEAQSRLRVESEMVKFKIGMLKWK